MDWKSDLRASIVVFLVALPLCLGIALASNAPLSAGLFAGILGGIVIGWLSGSHVSVSGPAAGLTVIVINGISSLGSFETFTLAVMLSGIFQIIFGLLRGGAIGNFFPTAVIRGMLAAIGLILILKQYPNVLGLSSDSIHVGIILISLLSIALMLWWDKMAVKGIKFFKLIPGALVAVILSILLNSLYSSFQPHWSLSPEFLVQLPFQGGFAEVFSLVKLPDFSQLFNPKVLEVAMTIAIVASLETLLSIDAGDKIDPLKRESSKNRELLAQGTGNIVSGLVGGLPLTAVIVRTSANVSAGAATKLSAILHGVWLFACVVLIPGVLNLIPLATLACVLLLTGYKLCKPQHFKDMKARGWDQLFIFSVTIMGILTTDLLKGIFIGIGAALVFEFRKTVWNPFTISHETEKSVLQFTHNVSFFHKTNITKALDSIPAGKTLFIKKTTYRMHVDVHEHLRESKSSLEKRSITVIIEE